MTGLYASLIFTALGAGTFFYFFFKSMTHNEAAEKYNAQLNKE